MATITRRTSRTSYAVPSGRRLGAAWAAVLLAVLLAFSWQSVVAQTHNHFDRLSTSALAAPVGVAATASPGRNSPFDSPANCPICREIAHSVAYLPPAPIVLPMAPDMLLWLAIGLATGLILQRRPLGWHSRAPPTQLQA